MEWEVKVSGKSNEFTAIDEEKNKIGLGVYYDAPSYVIGTGEEAKKIKWPAFQRTILSAFDTKMPASQDDDVYLYVSVTRHTVAGASPLCNWYARDAAGQWSLMSWKTKEVERPVSLTADTEEKQAKTPKEPKAPKEKKPKKEKTTVATLDPTEAEEEAEAPKVVALPRPARAMKDKARKAVKGFLGMKGETPVEA
jgi:hypothetical protein